MRILAISLFLIVHLVVMAGQSLAVPGPENQTPTMINVERLNATIEDAVSGGAQWPESPLLVTEKLLGAGSLSFLPMAEEDLVCSDDESLVTVVIMRGGFRSEVGFGDWCEIHLRREPDGSLRLCYILPMNKTGARTRNPDSPLKVRPVVHRVE